MAVRPNFLTFSSLSDYKPYPIPASQTIRFAILSLPGYQSLQYSFHLVRNGSGELLCAQQLHTGQVSFLGQP